MEFRTLGDLEVLQDGQALALGSHQQRVVLAVLVLSAGEVVSADRLSDALWGERPPASAAKTVQVYISRLRKALAAGGERIVTVDHGYVLRIDPQQVDARAFERLLDQGRRAYAERELERAAAVLRQALGLWRGAPLADFTFDAFAANEIARLQELRLEALETRIDVDLALGHHAALVAELEALTVEHPLRERLRAARMLALYRCGREPEALALYRQTRTKLVEELGMEPSPALRELHDAMLRQDPALAAPAAPPGSPSANAAPVTGGRRRRVAVAVAALGLAGAAAVLIALIAHGGGRANVAANSVAVIDPARNAVVDQVAVGARPGDISAGAGGIWVANLDDNSISKIDPGSATVKRTLSIPGAAIDALAADTKALWTIDYARATATRIDPAFGNPVRTRRLGPTPWDVGVGGSSAVAIAGGSVWAATGNATVSRLDARSGRVRATVPVGNDPAAIAVGDGAAWVADSTDNTVTAIDAVGPRTGPLPVGHGAGGIAVGYGGVWVTNTLDDTVTRIDPATGATKANIPVGAGPRGVGVGAGAVWVANSRGASVSRIDPQHTGRVVTIPVGGSPEGVVVDAGRVWVTVQARSQPPDRPVAGGILRIVQPHDFGSTDPAVMGSFGDSADQLRYATCAKLLDYPDRPAPVGDRLVPEVATALPKISHGGRTYTFTVRPGYRFSPPSNQPVTARAFQRAIERVLKLPSSIDTPDIVGAGAYRAGRTTHVAGVSATARTLTIRLVQPSPTLPARIAMPRFCAVPPDTPVRAEGVKDLIPSAGPYYIAAHTPKELVLRRNPNYHGPRPRHFDEIDYDFGSSPEQGSALVEAGHADYADNELGQAQSGSLVSPEVDARLERRYGPHSPAARSGRQRYFIDRRLANSYLLLNARRVLFAGARMRRAANFAVNRPALARNAQGGFSSVPTDQSLPPGTPGFRDADIYPLGGPDLGRARHLAGTRRARAVMYTCNTPACRNVGAIVKANLGAIGIDVRIRQFPYQLFFDRVLAPRAQYDIAWFGWIAGYADPSQFIDASVPGFALDEPGADARRYRRRMASAAALSGARRLRAYGQLDIDLATHVAPVVAFADTTARDFFSPRIGCQTYQPFYGMDLAALCLRHP